MAQISETQQTSWHGAGAAEFDLRSKFDPDCWPLSFGLEGSMITDTYQVTQ